MSWANTSNWLIIAVSRSMREGLCHPYNMAACPKTRLENADFQLKMLLLLREAEGFIMRQSTALAVAAAAIVTFSVCQSAHATSIVQIPESAFNAGSGLITFSEVPLGTQNPVYPPALYSGGAGSPTVIFGGFFTGQSLSANASVDCPGAAATGCVVGNPTGPLSLAANSPVTFTANDGANPRSELPRSLLN
jgi:hypothetical protein